MNLRRPQGAVLLLALMAIIVLGALCTTATVLQRSSGQFMEAHESSAEAQHQADSELEEALAKLNASTDAPVSRPGTIEIHAGPRKFAVELVKNGGRWKVASYKIAE